MKASEVSAAYGARATQYVELFGEIDSAAQIDRDAVLAWARGINGRVIDVGCGPGQWTNYLSGHAVDIEGIDLTPEFVAAARRRYPANRFRIGQAEDLGAEDASLGGILSWYSLIHTDPRQIGTALSEFARCLRPGGRLALGFFEGPELVPFDHAVATAYYWPLNLLKSHIEKAGFVVTGGHARTDAGVRRQGLILAERRT